MKLSIIDLGTNSVRFDIYEIIDGEAERVHVEKQMIRLGDGVFDSGKLSEEAINRTLESFKGIKDISKRMEVDKTVAFATCALRSASNAKAFVQKIKTEFGIDIEVISGEQEAKLIAKGILNNEETPEGVFLLIDIGGGSTEISICRKRSLIDSFSFELGANRLQQTFLKKTPPSENSINELRRHIHDAVVPHLTRRNWPTIDTVVGSSGTIKALRKIIRLAGAKIRPFKASALKKQVKRMCTMSASELSALPGLEPKRVDLILSGGILLEELLQIFGSKRVFYTDFNLRHGILENELEKMVTTDYFK